MTNDLVDPVSVLIADPFSVVREGLKAILNSQPNMRVVGETGDGADALTLAEELNPGLVILETYLPRLDGAQVTARLRDACPDRKIVALTACEHLGSVRLVLGMGARGYLLKRSPAENLLQGIRAVIGGHVYIDPELARDVHRSFPGGGKEGADSELSTREGQVVRLIALGYSNKEIAARLEVSIKTVETYKARSLEKLHLRSRVDIVRFAARCGWLTGDASEPIPAPPGSKGS